MWATPAGERWLVAARQEVADFVSSVYDFDRVVVCALRVASDDPRRLHVEAPDLGLDIHLEAGRGWPIPAPRRRPRWVTRYVEAPVARRLLHVEAYGVSPSGWREWYQASRYRPLTSARATLDGADLGPLGPLDPPTRFGFSEPPRRPSLVEVTTRLEAPRPRR